MNGRTCEPIQHAATALSGVFNIMAKKPEATSGTTRGYTNSAGLRLYTDGETFAIRQTHPEHPNVERGVALTKEEMLKVLHLFAPYFSNHDFGLDDG